MLDMERVFLYLRDMKLTLEVSNRFAHPKEYKIFLEEIENAGARIEDSDGYTEQDTALVSMFEQDCQIHTPTEEEDHVQAVLALSNAFPSLIFVIDAFLDEEMHENNVVYWREYVKDGMHAKVHPYQVVPDFDPNDLE